MQSRRAESMDGIEERVPLKHLTTFKIGGDARYFFRARSVEALRRAIAFANEKRVPVFFIGGGSNLLVSDGGFPGLVIKMEIMGIGWKDENDATVAIAGAGESWDMLVRESVERSLFGLENLSGIPGTVGGAPVQNIGAYGEEVKDTIEWVEVFDTQTGALCLLSPEECAFGYRTSMFRKTEGKDLVITRVAFRLMKNGTPNASYKDVAAYFKVKGVAAPTQREVREAIIEIRAGKFPDLSRYGTAGSFFKNPILEKSRFAELKKKFPDLLGFPTPSGGVKVPLAWILDKVCGLKGFKKGDIGLFEKQPLVLVNKGHATAREARELAEDVAARVRRKTGIELEWEVQYLA